MRRVSTPMLLSLLALVALPATAGAHAHRHVAHKRAEHHSHKHARLNARTAATKTTSTTATVTGSSYQPLDDRVFSAPTSVWNQPLAPDAPIASYSDTYVQSLQQQVAQFGDWINTDHYSVPVYTVPSNQATVRVTLDNNNDPTLTTGFQAVPLPSNARPAAGTDGHLVVWQPSTQTEWEFWRLYKDSSGNWHTSWGGKMTNVSANPGWFAAPYGATATSLALPDGLMTIQEQANGVIPHALAIAVPQTIAGVFVAPAQRDDGNTASWSAIPEGMRFRLPASLNVDALGLPRETAMIAKAVQQYGMIVRDTGGTVAFYGEDQYQYQQKYGYDPYSYLFGGQYANQLLASFPWSQLQVVQP